MNGKNMHALAEEDEEERVCRGGKTLVNVEQTE